MIHPAIEVELGMIDMMMQRLDEANALSETGEPQDIKAGNLKLGISRMLLGGARGRLTLRQSALRLSMQEAKMIEIDRSRDQKPATARVSKSAAE